MSDKEEKKKISPIWIIIGKVFKTLIPPLGELNSGLRTCYRLTSDNYYRSQIFKNNLFRIISYIPIVLAYYVLYLSVVRAEVFKPKIKAMLKGINIKNITSIKVPEEFYSYLVYTLSTFAILFVISAIIILFVKNTHPLLRGNKKVRRVFSSRGIVKDANSVLIDTPRGILLEYEGDIDEVIKNKGLWATLDKSPKEPQRDEDNKNLYYIGYGFKLENSYVFKF